ncbi:MAG: 16S rRNA (cytosine(1402)-N(4))-methyltransferase RsmH [Candidatus Electrothrix sp. GW3-4]|uniref:16S rRNA (cytosine(1402)-N(4))-methyltransferase RsmH n=1 Tax=Candidatus Electrothrix sp. GW3-4 TaxID=3126740 RepID=UPI0030CA702E
MVPGSVFAEQEGRGLHIPVLFQEVMEWLRPSATGCYVDGTLGLGGHTEMILEQSAPAGRVLGFEWDGQAARFAAERLAGFGDRFQLLRASYADMAEQLQHHGQGLVDGILVDLGVSSLQLDCPERGFSFRDNAPLDMRMDTSREVTAEQLVNRLSQDELADVFFHYGEERQARRVARFIVEAREQERLETTRQLADLVALAIPKKYHPKKIHVATKVFQALRIAVNRELENLTRLLTDGPELLKPGARFCIITFHSLEDRMVKQAFAKTPHCKVLTNKPVLPTADEVRRNSRARSAKLRVAERL